MEGEVLDYKLAWADDSDKKILHSMMFETLEAAVAESANHKNPLIFKLNSMDNGTYSWTLLPYGLSTWYQLGLTLKDYVPIILIATGALVALSVLISSSSKKEMERSPVL